MQRFRSPARTAPWAVYG